MLSASFYGCWLIQGNEVNWDGVLTLVEWLFKENMSNAFLYSMNSTLKERARGFKTRNEIFQKQEYNNVDL